MLRIGTAYVRSTAKTSYWIYRTNTKIFKRGKSTRRVRLGQCFFINTVCTALSFAALLPPCIQFLDVRVKQENFGSNAIW